VIYEFLDTDTGEHVEAEFPHEKAPKIGSIVRRNGRRLKRLPPNLGMPVVEGDMFRNYQVRRGSTQATGADGYDKKNRPYWTSAKRAAEWARKKTGEGIIPMEFDG